MGISDMLDDKIYAWLEHLPQCAQILNNLSLELESLRENVNLSQVVGNTVSVGGAATMLGAGILTLATGGAFAPIAVIAAVSSGLGLATSVGSDIAEMFISSSTMKDAEKMSQRITYLENEIQRLTDLLVKEAEKEDQKALSNADIKPEDYVVSCILKTMAERSGVKWHDNFLLLENMLHLFKTGSTVADTLYYLLGRSRLSVALLSQFIFKFTTKAVLNQSGTAGNKMASKWLRKLSDEVGSKLAVTGVACVSGGAIGLAFTIPNMIKNWKDMIKHSYKTEACQSLRDTAETLLTTAKDMKREIDDISHYRTGRNAFVKLANVNFIIENLGQSAIEEEREELLQFVMEHFKDIGSQVWLKENSNRRAFFHLVERFHFLKKNIDQEEKTNLSKHIDITFLAHGYISDPMVPASCLMPLDTIHDVVLYTPWNCYIDGDAAYAIAAGRMKPHHREFVDDIYNSLTQPTTLPNEWNSIKKTGKHLIPNIFVSPLRGPEDGFWERFESLKSQHGLPPHCIVVPYMKNSHSSAERVPFYIVTLALSLVLIFSRFKATLHLTTCLGRSCKEERLDKAYLERQYACTDDDTTMTVSEAVLHDPLLWLYEAVTR